MIVIPGITITDDILISSTVPEPDISRGEALWDDTVSYVLGQEVIRLTTHRIYENTLAGVDAGLPEDTPLRWLDKGPTNRWAMFDTERNSKTITSSPLTVVLAPGVRVDSLGAVGMEARNFTLTSHNGATEIYRYEENLNTRQVFSWYQHLTVPFTTIESVVKFDLPPLTQATITLTLESDTGTVACGGVVVDRGVYIGKVQWNPNSDGLNFSRIERNFDGTFSGNNKLVPRRSVPKLDCVVEAPKLITNRIIALRNELNAKPALWCGLDDQNTDSYFNALQILGIYKKFGINVDNVTSTFVTLELEEI